jgi:hypothetical protein
MHILAKLTATGEASVKVTGSIWVPPEPAWRCI